MTRIKWFSIIRVFGLALVLLYHFSPELLSGGFLGVDIFFTFSGYLVTMLFLETTRQQGEFRLFFFWKRRFIRIFPPLFFSILFTLPFALLISPDFTAGIERQITAAISFVANYFEILSGGSYEEQLLPHLYLHTWFLAVEIHLYILWGIILALLTRIVEKKHAHSREKNICFLKYSILSISLLMAAVSYLQMQNIYSTNIADPSAAYFGTHTHGFPFMLGAAAGALFPSRRRTEKNTAFAALSISGITLALGGILLLSYTLSFNAQETYQFGIPAVSLLTILLIQTTLTLHHTAPGVREPKPLLLISDLSYCLYLFHWPLYVIFLEYFRNNLWAVSAALVLSAAFSLLIHCGIQPWIRAVQQWKKATEVQAPTHHSKPGVFLRILTGLITLSAAAASAITLVRAPNITSLEAELRAGYLYQDISEIEDLHRLIQTINDSPLSVPDTFPTLANPLSSPILPLPTPVPPAPEIEVPVGVVIIGDSVCMGAAKSLRDSIPDCYVDAAGSRQIWQGYDILMDWQEEERLREYVVVALGTNQNSNALDSIDRIIEDLPPGHRLILVTPYDRKATEKRTIYKTAEYMRTLPELYPFVTVADWAAAIEPESHLLGSDSIHIGGNSTAIGIYTDCITDAIARASEKPYKESEQ